VQWLPLLLLIAVALFDGFNDSFEGRSWLEKERGERERERRGMKGCSLSNIILLARRISLIYDFDFSRSEGMSLALE